MRKHTFATHTGYISCAYSVIQVGGGLCSYRRNRFCVPCIVFFFGLCFKATFNLTSSVLFFFFLIAQNHTYIHISLRYIFKSIQDFQTWPVWDFSPMDILHKQPFSESGFKVYYLLDICTVYI